MPREVRTIPSSWSAEEAFAFMVDFSNAAHWDPGVRAARRLDEGTVGHGSAFSLDVAVGARTVTMRYEVTRIAERSVTFRAALGALRSEDTVAVEQTPTGCCVVYDAGLTLVGPARLANPVLAVVRRIVDRAAASLRDVLTAAR